MKIIFRITALLIALISGANSQWTEQSSGVTTALNCVSAIDNNNAWICADSGKVLRTTNGGTNWTVVTNPSSANNFVIFGIDASSAFVAYYQSPASTIVKKTSNGGSNWTQVFSQPNGSIRAIWMTSSTNGFMAGDPVEGRWSFWKTTNGGVNWDSTGMYLAAQPSWYLYSQNSLFISGSNYYLGSSNSGIYYSSNSGQNWVTQPLSSDVVSAIWFNNATTGLCAIGDLSIGKTTNNGNNWSTLPNPGTDYVNGIVGNGTNFWMTCYGYHIWKTINNGNNWTMDYISPVNHNYTYIARARTGGRMWAVTDAGDISKNDGLVGVIPVSNEIPATFNLGQNYPNPFNPSTSINFSIPSVSSVSMKIYDILGNEVLTVVNENLQAGAYSVRVDLSDLSSGIYFYTIKAGGFIDTKKMILVK